MAVSDMKLARLNMVESQVRPSDVTDRRIIRAMSDLPREVFVPASLRSLAYMDHDIPLDSEDHNASKRYLMGAMPFAKLIQLAEISPTDIVLDVGCGTGYSTVVLAQLAESVVGLEVRADLADQAAKNLSDLNVDNAAIVTGSLQEGYVSESPYDVIIINGSVSQIPESLLNQLKDNGRLAVFLSETGLGKAYIFRRSGKEVSKRPSFEAAVPILPGFEKTKEFVF